MDELARRMVYEQWCRNLGVVPYEDGDAMLDMLRIVALGPLAVKLLPLLCKDMLATKHTYLLWPLGAMRISQALANELLSTITRLLP